MSIEDRLSTAGEAWRQSQPPVAVEGLPAVRRTPSLWLPLTAAAATVAVAIGATLLVSRDDSPAPVASGVVPFVELRPGEADVPAPLGFADFPPVSGGFIPTCRESEVTGTFKVTGVGRGRLAFTSTGGCLLSSQSGLRVSTVTGDGGEYLALVSEPRLTGSPEGVPRRGLSEEPLLIDLDFTGQCLGPPGFAVEGIVSGVLRVPGTPVCADRTDGGRFEAGPLHVAGEPHAEVPGDRAGLRVAIEVEGPAPLSGPLDYQVRISNPTSAPISLKPCPVYRTGLYRKDSAGESFSGSGGRLNCDAAPGAVAAGGSVVFAMRHATTDADGVPGPADVKAMSLRWAIAGPAAAAADVPVSMAELAPSATPTGAPSPPASAGTVTSLLADLDDDGRPDAATVDSATGLVVVTTASGELPALQLPPSSTLELQGVLPLSGTDGLLVSTTSAARTDQSARVIRIVNGRLRQILDGDRPLLLPFVIGRGDTWAGVECDEDGESFEVVTRAIIGGVSLEVEETRRLMGIRGVAASFSERPSRRLTASSSTEAVRLASAARTRCPGLDSAGNGDVLGDSGP